MPEYIIWADKSAANDLVAPTTDKQHLGWVEGEQPPHEYFNWMQNQNDRRLTYLESPVTWNIWKSYVNTRTETISAGVEFTVPEYVVGAEHLEVYLDGVYCFIDETYQEVGVKGAPSTVIKWMSDISPEYSIMIRTPIKATEKVSLVTSSLVDLETLIEEVVSQTKEASSSYSVYAVIDEDNTNDYETPSV